MKYAVCPRCKNLIPRSVVFCLFCGKALQRGSRRIAQEFPNTPRVKITFAGKAQRALIVLSLIVALWAVALALISPVQPPQQALVSPAVSAPLPAQTPDATAPAPSSSPEPGIASLPTPSSEITLFSSSSGEHSVELFVSEVTGDDPSVQSRSDALTGKLFNGVMTIAVNAAGSGTISIDHELFSPEAITVSAFTNSEGLVSDNTLYGISEHDGMNISVVCVCEAGGISGFIWMDSANMHVEFLYFG